MKKISLFLLVAVMLLGVFTSCGNAVKPVTVQISFVDQNGETVISESDVTVKKENPTIIDAVNVLRDTLATITDTISIVLDEEGVSVVQVNDFKENLTPDANNMIKYWTFTVNEDEPAGDASEIVIHDGEKIVFKYVVEEVEE